MLPSRGWTGGLFGQRDRCLLVLSQLARIPHQQLATLTAGDIAITGVVATITGADRTWTVEAGADPVLCGPCAIARWLTTHQVIVTRIATRAVADHLDRLKPLTGESSHVCREPFSVSDRAASGPLLAPVTEWGHAPFPLSPMSRTLCLGRPGTCSRGASPCTARCPCIPQSSRRARHQHSPKRSLPATRRNSRGLRGIAVGPTLATWPTWPTNSPLSSDVPPTWTGGSLICSHWQSRETRRRGCLLGGTPRGPDEQGVPGAGQWSRLGCSS
jgi:hypothetical protein